MGPYTGTFDNGGVHTNSGIANHWYSLLVNGGQNATPRRASGTEVQGIGLPATEQIASLGCTALPATATFCDTRAATIAVGGNFADNAAAARNELGVDEVLCSSDATGGGGDTPASKISNVSSSIIRGTKFYIQWLTDVPATGEVISSCCGTYRNSSQVTEHRMTFNGQKGFLYEHYVSSSDAGGRKSTAGPYYHQN